MPIPSDYRELLKLLNKHRVKYLVVGAYAVIFYTEPRYTKDIDIWIKPDMENAAKTLQALKEFGAPLRNVTARDFTDKTLVYQIGVAPVRIDILMGLPGLEFPAAWRDRKTALFEGIRVNIIGKSQLMAAKRTGRPSDAIDLEKLRYPPKSMKKA